jgi:hypothetical protein
MTGSKIIPLAFLVWEILRSIVDLKRKATIMTGRTCLMRMSTLTKMSMALVVEIGLAAGMDGARGSTATLIN